MTSVARSLIAWTLGLSGIKPRCRHVYRGVDLRPRDATGQVEWPCSICGEVARAEHGLEVLRDGATITGPWGHVPEKSP